MKVTNEICRVQQLTIVILFLLIFCVSGMMADTGNAETLTVTDAWRREIAVPAAPAHILCSGAGCLRYLTYLQAQDSIVAVDDIETRDSPFNARPYALANPQFKEYPIFGEFRGHDNPELIVSLEPQPQVIFKTYGQMGHNPEELQAKTGIPVIVVEYGDLSNYRDQMYQALRIMGTIMGKEKRAEAVIAFFEQTISDLQQRTASVPDEKKISCYVGGIAFKGPHGLQSTEPTYPPFLFTNAQNVAYDPALPEEALSHADVAKEKIIEWDPEVIFIDISTTQTDSTASALYQLRHDPAYQHLRAVTSGNVYGVLPYNSYTQNFGSTLANAYYVGKLLYPDHFADIEPTQKADEIYTFLVGKGVFEMINEMFGNQIFTQLHLKSDDTE